MTRVSFAAFGTGAAGVYFGRRLAQDVRFMARGAQHLAALRQHGLQVDSLADHFRLDPVGVTDDPAGAGPGDVVRLGVKAWQAREGAESRRPLLGERTFVVPLQNGVEAPNRLATALGP